MPGKINIYNLGQLGVDIVNAPFQVEDGAFLSAQNGQISNKDDQLAIRKRDGMSKVNTTAAAGTVLAFFMVASD